MNQCRGNFFCTNNPKELYTINVLRKPLPCVRVCVRACVCFSSMLCAFFFISCLVFISLLSYCHPLCSAGRESNTHLLHVLCSDLTSSLTRLAYILVAIWSTCGVAVYARIHTFTPPPPPLVVDLHPAYYDWTTL